MYDIIGDIHGHAGALKALLTKMDYTPVKGTWQHPERRVIFVGDYIDRGPSIRETLQIVRSMTEGGQAYALMGNHEYNALAYHYQLPDGSYLRSHNQAHLNQHAQTLAQFYFHRDEWISYLEWFTTLPLFLELEHLRAVHACWDQQHINFLRQQGYATVDMDFIIRAHHKSTIENLVVEETLKGKEIPVNEPWEDKDGHMRTRNRVKWWVTNLETASFDEALFNCPPGMKNEPYQSVTPVVPYPSGDKPVFCGHYWLQAATPSLQAPNVACLDYSIAKEGMLVAYQWNGEKILSEKNFVWV